MITGTLSLPRLSFRALHRLSLATAMLALFLPTGSAHAQSPRISIIEEITNASCPPCAGANPYFERYLARHEVRERAFAIVYHAPFPGRDIMNAANPAMHNARSYYYPLNGIPSVFVNGGLDVAPSRPEQLDYALEPARGALSPITIEVEETRDGNMVEAKVTITSTEPIVDKRLRIVAVEGHHYYDSAGTNGEKSFPYIARAMLPDAAGIKLSLAAGEQQSFTQSYTIDAGWHADEMYIVAFVQDDRTREILQAGSSIGRFMVEEPAPATVVRREGNDGSIWSIGLTSGERDDFAIEIERDLSPGWSATVVLDETPVDTGTKYTFDADEPRTLRVAINPTGDTGRGAVRVTLKGKRGRIFSRELKLFAMNGVDVVVMMTHEDWGYTIPRLYREALARGSRPFMLLRKWDELDLDLTQFKAVVCEAGTWLLDYAQVAKLRSLLDADGRLLITGMNIGYGLGDSANVFTAHLPDTAFLHGYLRVRYVADSTPSHSVRGVPGDSISDGLGFAVEQLDGYQTNPDVIAPLGGAQPFLYYGDPGGSIAATRNDGERGRLVFFGFGLDRVADVATRADLLERSIDWLLAEPASTGDIEHETIVDEITLGEPHPNPASNMVSIPIALRDASHVTLSLHDTRGESIMTIVDRRFEGGHTAIQLDASRLAPGVYTIVMQIEGSRIARQLSVVR